MRQPVTDGVSSAALAALLTEECGRLDLPERLIAARRATLGRIVFTTSFGIEDQEIIHAIFGADLEIDVITFDAGRLFPETLEVWGQTERRYGRQVRGLSPDRESIERLVERDGVRGFRQSLEARLACCAARKVEPLARALADASAWTTGLRADWKFHSDRPRILRHGRYWDGRRGSSASKPGTGALGGAVADMIYSTESHARSVRSVSSQSSSNTRTARSLGG